MFLRILLLNLFSYQMFPKSIVYLNLCLVMNVRISFQNENYCDERENYEPSKNVPVHDMCERSSVSVCMCVYSENRNVLTITRFLSRFLYFAWICCSNNFSLSFEYPHNPAVYQTMVKQSKESCFVFECSNKPAAKYVQ